MKTILLIEDHKELGDLIKFNLQAKNFEVLNFTNANDALLCLEDMQIDLILLDLMLPGLKGFDFLKIIKDNNSFKDVPVIIISAKNSEDDIVKGIEFGADDYIAKPFTFKLLITKIKAVLRRGNKVVIENFKYNDIEIDPDTYIMTINDQKHQLSKKEFDLMKIFIQNPNKILTRDQLLDRVWGYSSDVQTRTVDSHVSALRRKLGERAGMIKAISKVGYLLQ